MFLGHYSGIQRLVEGAKETYLVTHSQRFQVNCGTERAHWFSSCEVLSMGRTLVVRLHLFFWDL